MTTTPMNDADRLAFIQEFGLSGAKWVVSEIDGQLEPEGWEALWSGFQAGLAHARAHLLERLRSDEAMKILDMLQDGDIGPSTAQEALIAMLGGKEG